MAMSSIRICILGAALCGLVSGAETQTIEVGRLGGGVRVIAFSTPSEGWQLAVEMSGKRFATLTRPVTLEFYADGWPVPALEAGYDSFTTGASGHVGYASVKTPEGVEFRIEDTWSSSGSEVRLSRRLTVQGQGRGGFLSAVIFTTEAKPARSDVEFFVPGMIYGSPGHLTPVAIGGSETYKAGKGVIRIREDRLPAPVFGVLFQDGNSLAVLDAAPRGETTVKDSRDLDVTTLIDERFQFGAVGVEPKDGKLACGFWFPGSEGEVTYRGRMYPGGQVHGWRGRYHPLKDGLSQRYDVAFRFGREPSFPAFYRDVWRWAWQTLKPAVVRHDIDQARRSLVDMLATQTARAPDGKVGLINAVAAVPSETRPALKAVMGFTGKSLESAEHMLEEAGRDKTERGEKLRRLATEIFDSFTRLKVSPPEGEGFLFDSGKTVTALWPRQNVIYLRSFGDDMKATLRAIRRERAQGREHPNWLAWVREYAGWLLTQQKPDGSFPRTWHPGTGQVADGSPQSSYNPVPFLIFLSSLTGDAKYQQAALRAAEYCWASGQSRGRFVGGTIDNPDVIDKEAGTLSLEAYLAAYELTKETKWLARAQAAADFSETWIYIWNVPMPPEESDADLHWKRGVPTVGLQLIATGHSLVDEYMAFDTDEFAKLSVYAKDNHYRDVAAILLHNTKNMLALPGRAFDLNGPGWQQEHWSIAPMRGFGIHRLWLPWVSTSHLNGIVGLEEFDRALFRELAGGAQQ